MQGVGLAALTNATVRPAITWLGLQTCMLGR